MDETGEATVSRLIEILAGRTPLSQAPEVVARDVVSHMDGHTFRGFDTWASWLAFIRSKSRVGPPDLETDRLVTNKDGTIIAFGRWKGQKDGEPVLSAEVWARYRVVDGKIAEVWTIRSNYVFILGPIVGSRVGLLLVMLHLFIWSKTSGKLDLHTDPPASTESR